MIDAWGTEAKTTFLLLIFVRTVAKENEFL